MKKLVVGPVQLSADVQFTLSENPGIGGTEFATILTAIKLAKLMPDHHISLATVGSRLSGLPELSNLETETHKSWTLAELKGDIAIAPVHSLANMTPSQVSTDRLVAVSHHPSQPFRPDPALARAVRDYGPDLIAHVGRYSFWSNFSLKTPSFVFPNPIFSHLNQPRRGPLPEAPFVYVGALVPAKRFHDVARAWSRVVNKVPGAKLVVLGGAALYSSEEAHPLIPSSRDYGDRILRDFKIGLSEVRRTVDFKGVVSEGKIEILQSARAVIVNPTGNTEALSYSVREALRAGVPVIAGGRQGLSDQMRFFPELRCSKSNPLDAIILKVYQSGIDMTKFEEGRRRFLADELAIEKKANREASKLLRKLSQGESIMLAQVSGWPRPTWSVGSAILHEIFILCVQALGAIRDSFYIKLGIRNISENLRSRTTQR